MDAHRAPVASKGPLGEGGDGEVLDDLGGVLAQLALDPADHALSRDVVLADRSE